MAEDPVLAASRPGQRVDRAGTEKAKDLHHATRLQYSEDVDLQEAVANFRCYLEILQQWDRRERQRVTSEDERSGGLPSRTGMV